MREYAYVGQGWQLKARTLQFSSIMQPLYQRSASCLNASARFIETNNLFYNAYTPPDSYGANPADGPYIFIMHTFHYPTAQNWFCIYDHSALSKDPQALRLIEQAFTVPDVPLVPYDWFGS